MKQKRVTLFAGHYGSGKTNIAVNYALFLAKSGRAVTIADLDIVNPYYRSKDSQKELDQAGVRLICSAYANTNVDVPALPQEMYSVTEDHSRLAVIDVGGDDRGALALGRYTPALLAEDDYEMLFVANCCRPLTRDVQSTAEVMREIERAGGIPFTGIVNNTNLGPETTVQTVLDSQAYAEALSAYTSLPVRMTTMEERLYDGLIGRVTNPMPLKLQNKIW